MQKKTKPIPVISIVDEFGTGIAIEKTYIPDLPLLDKATLTPFDEAYQSHRHENHSFFLLETGTITIEIDFQTLVIQAPTVIYVHPDQVHRTLSAENVSVSALTISQENLNPDYLKLLDDITPAKPLVLAKETLSILSDSVSLCTKLSERENDKLHHLMLKDSCNALAAFVISQYLEQAESAGKLSRFDTITKDFRKLLERQYATLKRPAEYAQKLHLSTPYLNECVKNTTGYSVSHHIQQRVILEAKRLLYHSNKSVKEIASDLGYDDYPYFSRLFTKITQMTPLTFRNKNRD
ncbi:AraC family transcriptional regulator [Spirosoma linguale]|uniref:Transcriptional regulator, AraC family n=1 Tax=Spirosoma linguale (strain ATCC 33905 / DSM 74 / LMG 10896 / Claus 1) TaxID=504472 RepID=D2QIX5_SPILD|nr:transcriptional regulator, AraC family [Spirosoma linguale DSM 74]